eukprot:Rmarinus@m.10891
MNFDLETGPPNGNTPKAESSNVQGNSTLRDSLRSFRDWFLSVKILLFVFSVAQVVISACVVGVLWWHYSNKNVTSVLKVTMEELGERVEQRIAWMMHNATIIALHNEDAYYYGAFNLSDSEGMADWFYLNMKSIDGVAESYFGRASGECVGARYVEGDPTYSYPYSGVLAWPSITDSKYCAYHIDEPATRLTVDVVTFDDAHLASCSEGVYDPSIRPYYTVAADNVHRFVSPEQLVVWTDVYVWFAGNSLGVSASIPTYNRTSISEPDADDIDTVFATDVDLADLQYFLQELDFAASGTVVIIDRCGEYEVGCIVASSEPLQPVYCQDDVAGNACGDDGRVSSDWGVGGVKKVMDYLNGKRSYGVLSYTENTNLEHDGQLIRVVVEDTFLDWIVVLSVDRSDFTGDIDDNTVYTLIISACFVFVVGTFSVALTRWITKPLFHVSTEMNQIARFKLSDKEVKSSRLAEIKTIQDSMTTMKIGLRSFEKYVPAELVRHLLLQNKEAKLGMEEGYVTCFFSDIEGFTSISEALPLSDLVVLMGRFFEEWTKLVLESGGTVDKYIGDAIMAFWNAPQECPNHRVVACRTALKMQEILREMQEQWVKEGYPVVRARIGLHCGPVLVGNMGSMDRLNYTVLGDTVNLASRLEGANKRYGTYIMVSGDLYEHVKDSFLCRPLDIVSVKGREAATEIYELVSTYEVCGKDDAEFAKTVHNAFSKYKEKDFEAATQLFSEAASKRPGDKSVKYMIERIESLRSLPNNIDPVLSIQLTEK